MKIKAYIILNNTKKSRLIKNFLEKKIIITNIHNADCIIVLGGDGFMLETLKKYYKYNKSFYGINCGNYGFLMNKFSYQNTILNLIKATNIRISPLEMIVVTKNNIKKQSQLMKFQY